MPAQHWIKRSVKLLKVVNISNNSITASLNVKGISKIKGEANVILLTSDSLEDENSLTEPKKIYPTETTLTIDESKFSQTFKPYSLTILRLPFKSR